MSTAAPQNLEFFIAPDGDDAWSGTLSVPHADRSAGANHVRIEGLPLEYSRGLGIVGLRTDAYRTVLPDIVATAEIAP